jgi:hypothetical protein
MLTVFFKGQKPVRGMVYQVLNKNENEQQNNSETHQRQNQKVAVGVERLRKRKPVSGVNFFCSSYIGNKKMPYEFLLILLHSWVDSILPDDRSLSSVNLSLEN